METMEKNSVATLKAILVNDIEFVKETDFYNRHTPKYHSDFRVEVAIKVGNVVKNTTMTYARNYDRNKGEYIRTHTINSGPFTELIKAGIEIDFSDVMKDYKIAVAINQELQEKEKLVAKEKAEKERGIEYDNSWVHTLPKNVKGEIKKNFTLTPITKEDFVSGKSELYLTIKYNKISVKIFKNNKNQYTFNNGTSLAPTQDYPKAVTIRYISGEKTRRAKGEKTIINKVIESIDEYLYVIDSKLKREEREKKNRLDTRTLLSKVIGEKVTSEEEYKHNYYDRNSAGYYVWINKIKINEKDINVSIQNHTKYNVETKKHDIVTVTYTLGSFGNLSKKQIKAMVKILKSE